MNTRHLFTVTFATALLALAGCDPGGSGGDGGGGSGGGSGGGTTTTSGGSGGGGAGGGGGAVLKWYTTCGDPACGMPTDDPALADCMAQKEGDPCGTAGDSCEIAGDDCNTNLVCADRDPKDSPNGCPISQAKEKHAIEYLTDGDRERIREDVMTMPLATWKYNKEGQGEKEHLGFIIDDQPFSSPAVRPSGERVDLYGYTSMAVAAIQAQNRDIDALRTEVQALRDELSREKPATRTCSGH